MRTRNKLKYKKDRELVRIVLMINDKLEKNNYKNRKEFNELWEKRKKAEIIIEKRLKPVISYRELFKELDPEQITDEKYHTNEENNTMKYYFKNHAISLGLTEEEASREVSDYLD